MLALDWTAVDRAAWQDLLGRARCGLQQGWSYGEALRQSGVAVHRAVARDPAGRAVGCLQVVDRALFGPIGAGFLLRGPVWLDRMAAVHGAAVLADIRARLARRMLVWAPEEPSPPAARPVVTGYGTAWLDLAPGRDALRHRLAGDWRNALCRAEAGELKVRRLASPPAIDWLLDHNEAHRRQVGYRGPTRRFLGQLALAAREAGELLLLLAFERAAPVAGVMLLRHGQSATYEVGYVSPRGRELRATHLLLWRALGTLIDQQVRWLDLGGIATDRSPGIARFKLGLGGAVTVLPGTFLVGGLRRSGPAWPASAQERPAP